MTCGLLILDLDDTLADSFADIRYGITRGLEAVGVQATDELLEWCRKGVSLEYFYGQALACDASAPGEQQRLATFVDAYRRHYYVHMKQTQAYDGVAELANVPAADATMVGDTDRDLLAAQAAGCRAIAVTYGGWTRAELAPLGPHHLIDRFSDLAELI